MSRGAQDRPKLSGEKGGILFVNTYGAVAEERVVFGRDIQVRHRFIAADIHGAHDNAAPVCTFQRLTENVVQLVFAGRAGTVHIQHFGAKQANALGAVPECCLRFHRVGDVCGDLNAQVIGGSGFPVKPDALLLAECLLYPCFLAVVACHRIAGVDHDRTGIAINKYGFIAPLQQAFTVDADQRRNIKGTCKNNGVRGCSTAF